MKNSGFWAGTGPSNYPWVIPLHHKHPSLVPLLSRVSIAKISEDVPPGDILIRITLLFSNRNKRSSPTQIHTKCRASLALTLAKKKKNGELND